LFRQAPEEHAIDDALEMEAAIEDAMDKSMSDMAAA
jgi:hypothetical protein